MAISGRLVPVRPLRRNCETLFQTGNINIAGNIATQFGPVYTVQTNPGSARVKTNPGKFLSCKHC